MTKAKDAKPPVRSVLRFSFDELWEVLAPLIPQHVNGEAKLVSTCGGRPRQSPFIQTAPAPMASGLDRPPPNNGLPLGCSWSCGGWDWNAMTPN